MQIDGYSVKELNGRKFYQHNDKKIAKNKIPTDILDRLNISLHQTHSENDLPDPSKLNFTHEVVNGKNRFYCNGRTVSKKTVPKDILKTLLPESNSSTNKPSGYCYMIKKVYYLDGKPISKAAIPSDVINNIPCMDKSDPSP